MDVVAVIIVFGGLLSLFFGGLMNNKNLNIIGLTIITVAFTVVAIKQIVLEDNILLCMLYAAMTGYLNSAVIINIIKYDKEKI